MPALVNVAASMALGASIAVVLRRSPSLHDETLSWPLLVLLAFQALVVTPVATLLFRFYPQWSMFYWFDPQIFPELDAYTGILSAIAVTLDGLAAIAGFLLVRRSIVAGPAWLRWLPFAIAAGSVLWAFIVFPRRLVFIGDYDEFWRGEAHLMIGRIAGWVGITAYVLAVALVIVLRHRYANREPKIV